MIFPDYEEIDDEFVTKRRGARPKENLPHPILARSPVEEKVKIPSTPLTAFVQYTTEELDQLDRPRYSQVRSKENEPYPSVPPLVYGITPQESPADTDRESRKRRTPSLDRTVIKVENKQEKFEKITTPLTQFTQNILGTSVVTVKPKSKTAQTKITTQQAPIQPDFYLPDGKGLRLSEVHQIKTTEKSPDGHPAVLLILENLRAKYDTKYYLLDK